MPVVFFLDGVFNLGKAVALYLEVWTLVLKASQKCYFLNYCATCPGLAGYAMNILFLEILLKRQLCDLKTFTHRRKLLSDNIKSLLFLSYPTLQWPYITDLGEKTGFRNLWVFSKGLNIIFPMNRKGSSIIWWTLSYEESSWSLKESLQTYKKYTYIWKRRINTGILT